MIQSLSKPLTFGEFLEWYPSVYQLVEGEYQVSQFRRAEQIMSPTFPDLALTAAQVFQA